MATPGLYVGSIAVDDDSIDVSGEKYLVYDLVLEAVIGYAVDDQCVYFTGSSKDAVGVFTASKGGPLGSGLVPPRRKESEIFLRIDREDRRLHASRWA